MTAILDLSLAILSDIYRPLLACACAVLACKCILLTLRDGSLPPSDHRRAL